MALFLLSPLAGVFAERWVMRRMLNRTTFWRGFVYVVLVPLSWVLLQTDWIIAPQSYFDLLFWVVFLILLFCDGALVAFSNVVDIDCGGTNILAKQHGFSVDEVVLNRLNSLHTGWFDACMIVLSPSMAAVAVVTANHVSQVSTLAPTTDVVGTLGCSVCYICEGDGLTRDHFHS
jgi:hypothetical protein